MEMDLLKEGFQFYMLAPSNHENKTLKFKNQVKVYYFESYDDNVPFAFNGRSLKKTLQKLLREEEYIVVCEALPAAALSLPICKRNHSEMVYDCHGIAYEEVYLYHPNIFGKKYAEWLRKKEKEVVEYASLLIAVSNQQYKVWETEKPFCLLPMIPSSDFYTNDNEREIMRAKLNIPEQSTVFVYSGQNQKWQMSEKTIEFYKSIESESTFLVILTHQIGEFQKIVKKNGIKKYCIRSVPYTDMYKYLDACDFGFCLRENHVINLVASPTKVLEYLARNVKPILTKYVGDYSTELEESQMAMVLDDNLTPISFEVKKNFFGSEYVKRFADVCSHEYIERMTRL